MIKDSGEGDFSQWMITRREGEATLATAGSLIRPRARAARAARHPRGAEALREGVNFPFRLISHSSSSSAV